MKNYFNKLKSYIVAHKIISIVVFIIIIFIGYKVYSSITSTTGDTKYTLSVVSKGTVISSVDGSGQVSASSQIDLKPNVSGTITYIGVKPGDQVLAGKLLFSLDDTDAQKAIRDAEASLESARISLDKTNIQDSDQNLNANLAKAYDDGFSSVSDAFLDLPSTLNGLENLFNTPNLSYNSVSRYGQIATDYINQANNLYYQANKAFEKNNNDFRLLDRNSSKADIESIINETYQTTKILSDAIKSMKNLVDYLIENSNSSSDFNTTSTTLYNYSNTMSGHLSSLLSAQNSIKNYKDSFSNASLDIRGSELSLKQKQNALQDAKDKLSDYYIRAPFSGVMASVPVNVGEDASSGTVLGTIITSKKLATISLNEVDVAKVKLQQKATLTFDAIPDLTISGEVAEIDSIGTVSQGVVNYDVKISFDTQDDRVKSGMSVAASIITNMVQDVVIVPNSAVKTASDGTSYVQAFDASVTGAVSGNSQIFSSALIPGQIPIETGLADDTSIQIISGLKEGDVIVIKSVAGTTTAKTTPSILNAVGGSAANRGGAGGARLGN
jgi:HlyD family secretion protein